MKCKIETLSSGRMLVMAVTYQAPYLVDVGARLVHVYNTARGWDRVLPTERKRVFQERP